MRKTPLRISEKAPIKETAHVRNCILVHGWASDERAMFPLRQALQNLPQAQEWRFWNVSYDTSRLPFSKNAQMIVQDLKKHETDFSKTILIGYSMGGLVARQMVAEGFPCQALVTLCTPHHGPTSWLPLPMRGPRSLAQWSRFSRALNRHPLDVAAREKYHFFAMSYRDCFGFHQSDGMVSQDSALGLQLGEIASRQTMQIKYSIPISMLMPFDPHWRAMFPQFIQPAIRHIGHLMETTEESTLDIPTERPKYFS